jgi:hypothetical protein
MPFLSFLPFRVHETQAAAVVPPESGRRGSIAECFRGEELVYEIGVGPFKRVALGKLSFNPLGNTGRYLATLEAETVGVLGWVARYRVDTYRSAMEEIDGGMRLRGLSFEEDVKIGSQLRKKIYLLDHERRKWIRMRRRKDGRMAKTEVDIPPGVTYDDFLTAYYNFRYGVYGEIERGKKYIVSTFPRKGSSNYEVTVAGKEEEEGKKKREKIKEGKEFFVKLHLDPELIHSKEGLIEGWLSKDICPLEGTIKEAVFFGDIKGVLIKKIRS